MSVELILLSISLFTWGIGEGLFIYFQPIYLQQLGANTMTIASVFSAFGLAMMVAHIPAGYLADRIGRKPMLFAAWVAGLLATWIMALARTLPVFVIGMLLYGVTSFVSSPMNSYITAARGKLSPARAMTLVSAAFNFGTVLGPTVGGWIGDHVGLRTVYLVAACLFIISAVMLFFLRGQPRESRDPVSPSTNLLRNTRFVGFLGIGFLTIFVMYLPQPLTPTFLENERGLSLASIGLLGSVGNLGNTLALLVLGHFSARIGFLLTQMLVAAFSLLLWKGLRLPWYALGYFLLGGFRSARLFIFAEVRSLIHPAQMGLAYGVAETFNSLAIALAPLLAGVLYTRDPVSVYPASLGLIGVTMILSVIFIPHQKVKGEAPVVSLPPEL